MGAWTRRVFLSSLPLLSQAEVLTGDLKRFRDPTTEFDLLRVTDPAYNSYLPPAHLRPVTRRNNVLLFCSERSGSKQAYRVDLRSQELKQVGDAKDLDYKTLTFTPDERSAVFFDGPSLMQVNLANMKGRQVYSIEKSKRTSGFSISEDGLQSAFVEQAGGKSRLRLLTMARGIAETVLEDDQPISDVMIRPRRAGILYRKGNGLWLVNYDGQQNRPLKLAQGALGPALWSADGRTVLYLSYPEDPAKLNQLRECTPDSNEDKLVSSTSQFVNFARNADSSVFVGASRSKASAYILLLLRVTHRELTVCEHRASNPTDVTVIFSANSQRLFYHTDREGKSTIYTMVVDRFVEKTE